MGEQNGFKVRFEARERGEVTDIKGMGILKMKAGSPKICLKGGTLRSLEVEKKRAGMCQTDKAGVRLLKA